MVDLVDLSVTSDKDYLKVYDLASVLVSTTPGGDPDANPLATNSGSVTITHNLGTVPMVRYFYDPEKNGLFYDSMGDPNLLLLDPWVTVVSTTTTTKFVVNSFSSRTNIPVYYKLYDLNEYNLTSDYKIDKVFAKDDLTSGLVASSGSSISFSSTLLTIPHGQNEVPCFTVQFSEDQNLWYNSGNIIQGNPDTASGPPGGPYSRFFYTNAYGYADTSNLYINLRSNYGTAKTIYARYALDYRL